jgi:hypothetical protein
MIDLKETLRIWANISGNNDLAELISEDLTMEQYLKDEIAYNIERIVKCRKFIKNYPKSDFVDSYVKDIDSAKQKIVFAETYLASNNRKETEELK